MGYDEKTLAARHAARRRVIGVLLGLVLLVAAAFCVQWRIGQDLAEQSAIALQSAVRRAAVQCYAVEGAYPPDVKYLESNYGLQINHERYIVSYDAFASNCMPSVNVLVRGGTGGAGGVR